MACPLAASRPRLPTGDPGLHLVEDITWGWGEARAPSRSGTPLPRTEKGPGTGAGGDAWFTPPSCWEVCLFVLIVKDLDLFVRENSKESTLSKIQGSHWFLAVTPYHFAGTVSHDSHGVAPWSQCHTMATASHHGHGVAPRWQGEAQCSRDPAAAQGVSLCL